MGNPKKAPRYILLQKEAEKQQIKDSALEKALQTKISRKINSVQSFENQFDALAEQVAWRQPLNNVPQNLRAIAGIFETFQGPTKNPRSSKTFTKPHKALPTFKELCLLLFKLGCKELLSSETHIWVVFSLADLKSSWVRTADTWQRNSHNPEKQLSSLKRHLLAIYEVPAFLDQVWDRYDSGGPQWFVAVGQGYNIRYCNLPIELSKRMAHEFLQTPRGYTVANALRRAQVLGVGGDENLAYHICRSRLGHCFEKDDFWVTVIRFFAQLEMFDNAHIPQIIDYLHFIVFQERKEVNGKEVVGNPTFSMKGRTAEKLLAQSVAWHKRSDYRQEEDLAWTKAENIREEKWEIGENEKQRVYTLFELNSSKLLREEGRTMHHCVYSYAKSCFTKRSAIFSLRLQNPFEVKPETLATIEVNLATMQVVQIRGKCNARVCTESSRKIEDWARKNLVGIAAFAW